MSLAQLALTWDTGLALVALGLLQRDRIEDLATAGLAEGFDSPIMRQLAGGATASDPRTVFLACIEQLRIVLPAKRQAARHLARAIATAVVAGSIDPFDAARDLATVSRQVGGGFHELDPFIYAESEAQSRPSERAFFAKAIIDEASRWNQTGTGSVSE
jgi:hypothetical protein